jgi:hypothetical protein
VLEGQKTEKCLLCNHWQLWVGCPLKKRTVINGNILHPKKLQGEGDTAPSRAASTIGDDSKRLFLNISSSFSTGK